MTLQPRISFFVSLALAIGALAPAPSAHATPTTMTYAGRLETAQGPVNGSVEATFRLFDAVSGGTELYAETFPGLLVINGDLVADLGGNALDDSILAEDELWLEITVNGDVLNPRVRLTSVPYALRAALAEVAEEALTLGGLLPTDVVTQAQLASLGLTDGLEAGAGLARAGKILAVAPGGIVAAMIADGAVTSAAILDGDVGSADLQAGAVTSEKLQTAAVGSAQLAQSAVLTGHIADGAVSSSDLAQGAVTSTTILDGAVATADIQAGAVTAAKLANAAVGSTQVAQSAVQTGHIANGTILGEDISDATVAPAKLTGTVGLFQVTAAGCVEEVGTVTTDGACDKTVCGTLNGSPSAVFKCDGSECESTLTFPGPSRVCSNRKIGTILP